LVFDMSFPPARHRGRNWECRFVAKPWYVDVLAFLLIGVWMAWTYSTIQMHGPSVALVLGAVIIAAVGLLTIYGQRLRYLRIGNTVEIGMRAPGLGVETDDEADDGADEPEMWRERNR
jgi:hypothetical protein